MAVPEHAERAAFFRTALFLGLVRGESVVAWADSVLAGSTPSPDAFVEVATIAPGDLTALRLALLGLCSEREPDSVVNGLLGLIGRHLSSGRRSFPDTLTVLRQMRKSVKLAPPLADQLRQFDIDRYLVGGGGGDTSPLEAHLRRWLGQYQGAENAFLDERPD